MKERSGALEKHNMNAFDPPRLRGHGALCWTGRTECMEGCEVWVCGLNIDRAKCKPFQHISTRSRFDFDEIIKGPKEIAEAGREAGSCTEKRKTGFETPTLGSRHFEF